VAEADESDGSFLLLRPEVAVVTNVEEDHLDFYEGGAEVEGAFARFCAQAGTVVGWGDDPAVRRVTASASRAVHYGEGDGNDVAVESIDVSADGSRGRIRFADGVVDVHVSSPGRHYILNAAAAIAAAREVGVAPGDAAAALGRFAGVRRRFEHRGQAAGVRFVDDYAHHPTEIAATLVAARSQGAARLVAVFQPHRYTRTATQWRPMGESLAGADVVVLTDVYGAGELPVPGVTGKLLVDALLEASPRTHAVYLPHRADVAGYVARTVRPGDLVLTLGAGDVTMVGEETLALMREGAAR
jgi:UDP-N-acetylmuramate--alanine ligase